MIDKLKEVRGKPEPLPPTFQENIEGDIFNHLTYHVHLYFRGGSHATNVSHQISYPGGLCLRR